MPSREIDTRATPAHHTVVFLRHRQDGVMSLPGRRRVGYGFWQCGLRSEADLITRAARERGGFRGCVEGALDGCGEIGGARRYRASRADRCGYVHVPVWPPAGVSEICLFQSVGYPEGFRLRGYGCCELLRDLGRRWYFCAAHVAPVSKHTDGDVVDPHTLVSVP
jgi:hypothetical protein